MNYAFFITICTVIYSFMGSLILCLRHAEPKTVRLFMGGCSPPVIVFHVQSIGETATFAPENLVYA